ncbi:MAG: AbrB/MazE/SpoVT family DNA-binding domain-containing protein [Candidatus Micrarchaeota archaeon]|nr:AbrB/MazE/SpoVT family DNA-binding domain-containing protein [Candidatus Micrarchaeota archaeon]
MGAGISKVYKVKDKLAIYLPMDVVQKLSVKEGDELDFFRHTDTTFLLAKKDYIAKLLEGSQGQAAEMARAQPKGELSQAEISVLRKLDTLRYNERTKEKVAGMLSADEKQVVRALLKKKVISLFKKPGDQSFKFGISKDVYNTYLYGHRQPASSSQQQPERRQVQAAAQGKPEQKPRAWEQRLNKENSYVDLLESQGYIVLANEAEAASVSAALETSIRQGLVLGTRAFNKRFYIALRDFVRGNTPKLLKALGSKPKSVDDLSAETQIEPDGIRAIFYILAESGEISEVRKDTFRMA